MIQQLIGGMGNPATLARLHSSRWGILTIDMGIVAFSIILAHLLRFNFEISTIGYHYLHIGPWLLLGVRLLSFLLFRTYSGIVFYTGFEDAKRIFFALFWGSLILALVNPIALQFLDHYLLPFSIIIIEFMVSIFLMTAYRGLIKVLYLEFTNQKKQKKSVLIYGAGSAGAMVKNVLDRDAGTNYRVSAFVDDNTMLRKKRLQGVDIFPFTRLERLLISSQPDLLIFSDRDIPIDRRQEVVDLCMQYNVKALHVPPVDEWINGQLSFRQIREIKIEDLLERDPIQLDEENIVRQLKGKVILVSGAAGSIGSEIARQVIRYQPDMLVLLDQAETPLHDLDLEIGNYYNFRRFEVVLGDVRNPERMRRVFEHFNPDYVYHAAAYKHVPMMEHNPSESVLTNIKGTKILADLSVEFEVERFVLVSTDKAVNPTSIMGATKRMAEIYVQSLDRHIHKQDQEGTRFITTRFGNVLGSNGSVIPLFKRQILSGGPVTVTHPEMTRYFMTIPEACQLVLEAGAMGNGGEIYVFDMGKSIKILDLARKMIKLSGFIPQSDIPIVFTGLRPGEKLYEELLDQAEVSKPTHNRKILIAQVREYPFEEINAKVEALINAFNSQDNEKIVRQLKELIPEYKSNNSEFERLDSGKG